MEDTRNDLLARVITDPDIQGGKPVIRGTRVPVAKIIGALTAGASADELKADYGLRDEDIQAALAYAATKVLSDDSPA